METLKPISLESATGIVAENLATVKQKFGFVPNLYASFANDPHFLEGYLRLSAAFERSTNLTSMEKQIVLLTASLENHCQYCAAGYTIALRKLRADEEMIKSIRARETVKNDKYNALVDLTRSIVIERGKSRAEGDDNRPEQHGGLLNMRG